jgi:hypothetical protein
MKDWVAPRRIQEPVSIQKIGTETLVYDERRHQAFCLNESSSAIWLLADGERTITKISAAASLQLKTPVSQDLVLFAIEELRRDGLIESSSVAEAAPVLSRRVMLQRLGVSGALLLPMIAAVLAPTAAQAYGCVDCSSSRASRAKRTPPTGVPSQ